MGIMAQTLLLLFPRGKIWEFKGDGLSMISGMALSFDRAREAIKKLKAEAFPSTATDTLPEWHETLSVRYNTTIPVPQQQRMLAAIITAEGSSTVQGLKKQIEKEYSGFTIEETGPNSYTITGAVDKQSDALRIGAILDHFAPLHLAPTTEITILSDTDHAECGVAACGVAVAGPW